MKCTECGKPGARRAGKTYAMGKKHWIAFCGPECAAAYQKHKEDYARSVNAHNPWGKQR